MKKLLACALALTFLTAARAEDVSSLVEKLKDKDSEIRRGAAKSLAEAGDEAKPAVPALAEALKKDKDLFVRRYAAEALGALGKDAKPAVPALSAALKDEKKEVQEAAAVALGRVGAPAVSALVDALKRTGTKLTAPKGKDAKKQPAPPATDTTLLRRRLVEALGTIGPDAKDAVPVLTGALRDMDIRAEAAAALGEIGPDAKTAIPALKELADDKKVRDRTFKKTVADALKKIEKS